MAKLDKLCKDNVICCDDNCKRCANLIYNKYISQKAEIERLTNKLEQREEMMANLGVEFTTIQGTANYYKMHYEKAQAKVERLYIEGLQINKTFMDFVNKQIAEAIKEFAEKLKNCFAISGDYLDIINIIDNLVKEIVIKEFTERKVNL